MPILTAPKFRHFTPEAPALNFAVPSIKLDGSANLIYQYTVDDIHEHAIPSAMWGANLETADVYIDGVLQTPWVRTLHYTGVAPSVSTELAYEFTPPNIRTYLKLVQTNLLVNSLQYDRVDPIAPGMAVKIVYTSTYDGWYHLDIRSILIQGAHLDPTVLASHQQFQGGYRLDYEALDPPVYGTLRRCNYQVGWDYKPKPGHFGVDAFDYRLITAFGQKSEPACCSIKVG